MINLAIVDDHKMFRQGLRAILGQENDMDILLECENGNQYLEQLNGNIDITLLDLEMPDLNGMQTLEVLHRDHPEHKVIFVSQNKEAAIISNLMELGAKGYLHKDAGEKELIDAIRSVHESGYYFNDLVSKSLLFKLANKSQIAPTFNYGEKLSERERDVLELICLEKTTNEIAESLFISPKTVENHRSRMMEKTGVRNTAGLVVFAVKNNLINVA